MNYKIETIKNRIEAEINNSLTESFLTKENFFLSPEMLTNVDFTEMIETVKYIIASGGKRWRALLTVLFHQAFYTTDDVPSAIYQLASAVEFIHTASLIHDDIEDASELRRGKKAAHIKYGVDTALNAGSWLYFHALRVLASIQFPEEKKYVVTILTETAIHNLHLGQALDISWHRSTDFFPTSEAYEKMIRLKTGTLAGLAGALGVLSSNGDVETAQTVCNAMHEFGIAFQVLDDVKNITSGILGKDRGDDIVEGKKSLPVIYFAEEHPDKIETLSKYFAAAKQEGIKSAAVEKAIQLLNAASCISRTQEYANGKRDNGKKLLESVLPKNDSTELLMNFLAELL